MTDEAEFVGENPLERSTPAKRAEEDFRDSKQASWSMMFIAETLSMRVLKRH
jgi:hypothetical protein